MNARLLSYEDQLRSIRQDAEGLMAGLSDAQFNWPPAPGRWSMAGCFDHLNKSAARLSGMYLTGSKMSGLVRPSRRKLQSSSERSWL